MGNHEAAGGYPQNAGVLVVLVWRTFPLHTGVPSMAQLFASSLRERSMLPSRVPSWSTAIGRRWRTAMCLIPDLARWVGDWAWGRLSSGSRFSIKTVFSRYRDTHFKDKMDVRPSYLYDGNPFADKMVSSYWYAPPPPPENVVIVNAEDFKSYFHLVFNVWIKLYQVDRNGAFLRSNVSRQVVLLTPAHKVGGWHRNYIISYTNLHPILFLFAVQWW